MPHPVVPLFGGQMSATPPALVQTAADIAMPKGSIRLLHLHNKQRTWDVSTTLFVQESQLSDDQPEFGIRTALQSLFGTFLQPNILLLDSTQAHHFHNLNDLWRQCLQLNIGVVYSVSTPHTIDPTECIHVWIRPQSPDWSLSNAQQAGSLDLTLLLAIQLSKERQLPVRLITTLAHPSEHSAAEAYLEGLKELGRLPRETSALAFVGNIWDAIQQAPPVRVQIFGMPLEVNCDDDTATTFVDKVSQFAVGESLFVRGTGNENLLA